jgi:hypothetical protein
MPSALRVLRLLSASVAAAGLAGCAGLQGASDENGGVLSVGQAGTYAYTLTTAACAAPVVNPPGIPAVSGYGLGLTQVVAVADANGAALALVVDLGAPDGEVQTSCVSSTSSPTGSERRSPEAKPTRGSVRVPRDPQLAVASGGVS